MAWTVTRVSPTDNSENISLSPEFIWTKSGTGTEPRVEFILSRAVDLSDPILHTFIATALSISLVDRGVTLDENTDYYWAALVEAEVPPTSWKLTTQFEQPTLNSPVSGAEDVILQPLMEWTTNDGSTKFDLQLSEHSDFSGSEGVDQWTYSDIVAEEYQIASNLPSDTTIYWRVRAVTATVDGAWSTIDDFKTSFGVPSPPSLLNPSDTETGVSLSELLTWSDGGGAISYDLYVDESSSFPNSPIATSLTSESYRLSSVIVDNSTLYYWKVVSKNASGDTDSATRSFTTLALATPEKPILTLPADGSTIETNIPVLTWQTVENATHYHVQISDASDFSNIIEEELVNVGVNYSVITELDINTTYYWRVRAINDTVGGGWSDSSDFITPDGMAPGLPEWVYPISGQENVSVTPTFDWTDTANTDSWELQVSTDIGFNKVIIGISILESAGSEFTVGNSQALSYNTQYYVRVRSVNIWGKSSWVWIPFHTETTLQETPPEITYPADGATSIPLTFKATWTFDENNLFGVTYDLQISTSSGFNTLIVDETEIPEKEFLVTIPQTSYVYWIRVRAVTGLGNTGWSVAHRFERVNSTPPSQPEIIYPVDGDTDVNIPTIIDWIGNSYNTEWYQLQISTDIGFASGNIVYNYPHISKQQHLVEGLNYDTLYYVRVRGYNQAYEDGYGLWSDIVGFTTNNDVFPEPVTLIKPSDDAQNVNLTPEFVWSPADYANSYTLQISLDTDFDNHSTNVSHHGGIIGTTYTLPSGELDTKTKYYWRVRGYNHMGHGQSDVFGFTTEDDEEPTQVKLISPESYAGEEKVAPLFKWDDIGNSAAVKYELHISEESDFSVLLYDSGHIFAKEFDYNNRGLHLPDTNNPLEFYERYYWRVRGVNDAGTNGPWSDSFTFVVRPVPAPLKPVLTLPGYAEVMPNPVNVTFEEPLFADKYKIEIDKHGSFSDPQTIDTLSGSGNSIALDYGGIYFIRTRGIGRGGFGEVSEDTFFIVENTPYTSILSTMDLLVKAQLNVNTAVLTLTDLIASDYNTIHGLDLAEVEGMFKITGPNGIIYQNTGWDADDYASPDIVGATPLWEKGSITLPIDISGKVLPGTYKVEYKVTGDGTGNTNYTFSKDYVHLYQRPTAVIIGSPVPTQSYMIVLDSTNYDVTVEGQIYSPTNTLTDDRVLLARWPIGSGVSDSTTGESSLQLGPNLWTGNYDLSLVTTVKYTLPAESDLTIEVEDVVTGQNDSISVYVDDCTQSVQNCLLTLTARYEAARKENLPEHQTMKKNIDDIMLYYDMYKMAKETGSDTSYSCNQLMLLLQECGCISAGDTTLTSKEIIPITEMSGRKEFIVVDVAGQSVFPLPFTLTLNSLVMVEGQTLLTSQYSGFGSTTMVMGYTVPQGQSVIVIEKAY